MSFFSWRTTYSNSGPGIGIFGVKSGDAKATGSGSLISLAVFHLLGEVFITEDSKELTGFSLTGLGEGTFCEVSITEESKELTSFSLTGLGEGAFGEVS